MVTAPPTPLGAQCTFTRFAVPSKCKHSSEENPGVAVESATVLVSVSVQLRVFFDQPLFVDGVRSFERIYRHGKTPDVDEALHGTYRTNIAVAESNRLLCIECGIYFENIVSYNATVLLDFARTNDTADVNE